MNKTLEVDTVVFDYIVSVEGQGCAEFPVSDVNVDNLGTQVVEQTYFR